MMALIKRHSLIVVSASLHLLSTSKLAVIFPLVLLKISIFFTKTLLDIQLTHSAFKLAIVRDKQKPIHFLS
jgi:hypothetical protein